MRSAEVAAVFLNRAKIKSPIKSQESEPFNPEEVWND
jgi:hypothetical protein